MSGVQKFSITLPEIIFRALEAEVAAASEDCDKRVTRSAVVAHCVSETLGVAVPEPWGER